MIFLANVVWPALYLSQRYYSWWAIALGLVIETGVLYWLLRKSLSRCFLMALVANAISAAIGIFTFIWIGLAWEFVVSFTLYRLIPVGTFNPFGWFATTVLAAFLSSTLEWLVIRYLFKVSATRKFYGVFFAANFLTAGIAVVTLFFAPVKF